MIWAAEGEKGLNVWENGKKRRLCESCGALCAGPGCVYGAGRARGFCWDAFGRPMFDFPLPPGVCALARGRQCVYALSTEADCVCALDARQGGLAFSAPTGSYPRDLCLSPCGRYVAVAAGGAGEVMLFNEELNCVGRCRVAGVPCGICFLPHALAALCAVEKDDALTARLMVLSRRGVARELFAFPAAPCALCADGGGCLAGCQGCVARLRPGAEAVRRYAFPWPARIRSSAIGPLVCDPWLGRVCRPDGRAVYTGDEPVDVCVTGVTGATG